MATLGLKEIEFFWKMQKKVWYYEKWVARHVSFPPRRFVKIGIHVNALPKGMSVFGLLLH